MKFDAARVEGQRVVEKLLRKFRQDSVNAKWLGKMAVSSIERHFPAIRRDARHPVDVAAQNVPASQPEYLGVTDPVSPWSILSANELIEHLGTCSREEAGKILAEERSKLGRASVIEAALRRLG